MINIALPNRRTVQFVGPGLLNIEKITVSSTSSRPEEEFMDYRQAVH
jgi:hypothetical protein